MNEGLSPGVKDGEHVDRCSEVLGIGGDLEKRFASRTKQDVVDRALVLQGERPELGGQGEDEVEVGGGQRVATARFKLPGTTCDLALAAVAVAAGAVSDGAMLAVAALLQVSVQGVVGTEGPREPTPAGLRLERGGGGGGR